MNIVFFTHPEFFTSYSMPRYTKMLAENMSQRGHEVEVWSPKAVLSRLRLPQSIIKWLKYLDQYLIFPWNLKKRLNRCPPDTLFVVTDQALGPWIPSVAGRSHVIHCHDFLAQRSALGEIEGSRLSWTGKRYQEYIRRGYRKGRNFISVSCKTREELHRFLGRIPPLSEMVYNGLNPLFTPGETLTARETLGNKTGLSLLQGYLLHVGGNQWYKNRIGVIDIYDAWRHKNNTTGGLPLLLIGQPPSPDLIKRFEASPFREDIHFLKKIEDELLRSAYAGATLFLFPSLAEGFGWPIAEAMASGCPVVTTNETPMTEVAGEAGFLIRPRPAGEIPVAVWAGEAADVINHILTLSPEDKKKISDAGFENAARFEIKKSIDAIENIYKRIIHSQ